MNTTELDNFSITNQSDLDKLSDAYEGNLLNYFYGFTPEESRKFNKLKRQVKIGGVRISSRETIWVTH